MSLDAGTTLVCGRNVRTKNPKFHYLRLVSSLTPGDHMHEQPEGPPARREGGTPEWPRRGQQARRDGERPGGRTVARPLPDPVAIRAGRIPDTAPRYDGQTTGQASGPGRDEPAGERWRAGTHPRRDGAGRAPGGSAGTGPGRRVAASGRSDRERRGGPQRAGRPGQPRDGSGGAGRGGPEWPSRFAQVLAETLAGSRPPAQVAPWTTERARSHIRRLGPLLMAGQRPVVRHVVTSRPAPDVVEMSAVIAVAGRVRALAIRLELRGPQRAAPGRPGGQARWVCTSVEAA
jgi:hypothetical protein